MTDDDLKKIFDDDRRVDPMPDLGPVDEFLDDAVVCSEQPDLAADDHNLDHDDNGDEQQGCSKHPSTTRLVVETLDDEF